MEEERLDEMIRQTLTDSHAPPAPPLDEMWNVIEGRAFDDAPARGIPMALPTRWSHWSRWTVPAIAAAAAMLVGVALGWSLAPRGSVVTRFVTTPAPVTANSQVADAQSLSTPNTENKQNSRNPTAKSESNTVRTASTGAPATESGRIHTQVSVGDGTRPAPDVATARLASHLDDVGGSDMSRYLVRTAALLASLPSDRTTTATDSTIAGQAGELLIQTHLLLDSRAGSDPTLHKLLEDLELVLAQVARLSVQRSGTDLQLIHQAIAVRDVLPRVHDATVEASITE